MKVRINISVNQDTADRLKQYAYENHTTVSGAIEQWIWSTEIRNEQKCTTDIRGQISIRED